MRADIILVVEDELPVVVLVSGVPGSGKSTLARLLSERLAVPHLNKDAIRDGMRFSKSPGSTDEDVVWEVLYSTIEGWVGRQVSLVVDFTTYAGTTVRHISERVLRRCALVNVHCHAEDALERFERRVVTHPHFARETMDLAALTQRAKDASEVAARPLPLGRPVLEVDTQVSYRPDLDTIVRWILEVTHRRLPLDRSS